MCFLEIAEETEDAELIKVSIDLKFRMIIITLYVII